MNHWDQGWGAGPSSKPGLAPLLKTWTENGKRFKKGARDGCRKDETTDTRSLERGFCVYRLTADPRQETFLRLGKPTNKKTPGHSLAGAKTPARMYVGISHVLGTPLVIFRILKSGTLEDPNHGGHAT